MADQPLMYMPTLPRAVNVDDLSRYVYDEFLRISQYLQVLGEGMYIPKTHVAPTKLADGMVRYADGTNWNPGSGEGLYVRIAGAWVKAA